MVTYYNKTDMVLFGNYLLSEKRRELYKSHPELGDTNLEERLSNVGHWDFANWKENQGTKDDPAISEIIRDN